MSLLLILVQSIFINIVLVHHYIPLHFSNISTFSKAFRVRLDTFLEISPADTYSLSVPQIGCVIDK